MSNSTWKSNPENNDWNNADNWESNSVPNQGAMFSESKITEVTLSPKSDSVVDFIQFDSKAPAYQISIGNSPENTALTINNGVENNSENIQIFSVKSNGASYKTPQMKFTNQANAGGNYIHYHTGPTSLQEGFGGGIIAFEDESTAGAANFVARTGAQTPPHKNSTVGGEISFSNNSNAGTGTFTSYGTLNPPSGQPDTDTFGNIVFHDNASANHGTFISAGGTYGDGGNTQFYDNSNAALGTYINHGGTMAGANGGDTVFDGNSNGGNGTFTNKAATAVGGFGGVVSFNNNPPSVATGGSSAGQGTYSNYGATEADANGKGGGGGHIEFSALHGSSTADQGVIHNYGSVASNPSSAGHTIFSIQTPSQYFPSGGNARIFNHPAPNAKGCAGYTEFAVYKKKDYHGEIEYQEVYPTAEHAVIQNLGGTTPGAQGGYVNFSGKCKAANATLIATGGTHGGLGGTISFAGEVDGANAQVILEGNGTLDISYYEGTVRIGSLSTNGGNIITEVEEYPKTLELMQGLAIRSGNIIFSFPPKEAKFSYDTKYKLLIAPNLSDYNKEIFHWDGLEDGIEANFNIEGNVLTVRFGKK